MKIKTINSLLISSAMAAIILTGCHSNSTTETAPTVETITVEQSEIQSEQETSTENIDESEIETMTAEETEPETIQIVEEVTEDIPEQDETSFGTLENIEYTVDLTDIYPYDENVLVGNTSTLQGYSGVIIINITDHLSYELESLELEKGKTYIVTASPMITMSLPPQVSAIDIREATESEIEILEKTREIVSNYDECMERYESLDLDQIISDSNSNYATWTQEQIAEFKEYLVEKGYTDDYEVHSYVELRPDLNGSIAY